MTRLEYPVVVEPLMPEDGGGFAAIVPDLPGCMSDGEMPEDALAHVRDAITTWIEAARDLGRPVPAPSKHLAIARAQPRNRSTIPSLTARASIPKTSLDFIDQSRNADRP